MEVAIIAFVFIPEAKAASFINASCAPGILLVSPPTHG
jgi:hypothetical protein